MSRLANPPDRFVCPICLYVKGAMNTAAKSGATENRAQSPLKIQKDRCQCSALIGTLDAKLERLSRALDDSDTKNAATWTKVDKEHSLNEYLAISTPGPLAAEKLIQLSDAAIKTATASLVDRRLRESRLIIWGSCSGKTTPAKLAQSILSNVLTRSNQSLRAEWLRRKESKRTLGLLVTLSSPSDKADPMIRRLCQYRPPEARMLGHSRSGVEARKRFPLGTNSAAPKLMTKPIVVISTCTPESRSTKPAASPDSSYYSTTIGLSPTKGSDALEEANLTCKQHPKQHSHSHALLNKAPASELYWVRCAGTSSEANLQPRPVKAASLLVNITVAQGLDKLIHKHDYSHPEDPSYIRLATLVAGGSGVYTNTKEGGRQPSKPHKIRQIRELLAGFKVQSFAKTSLLEAPSKSLLLGAATQRPGPHRDTFPVKPRQTAQESRKAKACCKSLINRESSGQKKDLSRATNSNGRNFRLRRKTPSLRAIRPEQIGLSRYEENFASKKYPQKPRSQKADDIAPKAPSEPWTQTRRTNIKSDNHHGHLTFGSLLSETQTWCTTIKSHNHPGHSTFGSSPSEEEEAVLKCLYTNCLSLFIKLGDVRQSACLEKPSIIALTETWLTPDVSDAEISIDGYFIFRADSKRGRAGGVALYLHAALPIPIVLADTTPAPFCDALWVQIPLRGSDSLLLGVVYRSPSSPPEDDQFLTQTLGQLSSNYHFTHLLLHQHGDEFFGGGNESQGSNERRTLGTPWSTDDADRGLHFYAQHLLGGYVYSMEEVVSRKFAQLAACLQVRIKVQEVINLIQDSDKLKVERAKAKGNRNLYIGYGGSNGSGWSNSHYPTRNTFDTNSYNRRCDENDFDDYEEVQPKYSDRVADLPPTTQPTRLGKFEDWQVGRERGVVDDVVEQIKEVWDTAKMVTKDLFIRKDSETHTYEDNPRMVSEEMYEFPSAAVDADGIIEGGGTNGLQTTMEENTCPPVDLIGSWEDARASNIPTTSGPVDLLGLGSSPGPTSWPTNNISNVTDASWPSSSSGQAPRHTDHVANSLLDADFGEFVTAGSPKPKAQPVPSFPDLEGFDTFSSSLGSQSGASGLPATTTDMLFSHQSHQQPFQFTTQPPGPSDGSGARNNKTGISPLDTTVHPKSEPKVGSTWEELDKLRIDLDSLARPNKIDPRAHAGPSLRQLQQQKSPPLSPPSHSQFPLRPQAALAGITTLICPVLVYVVSLK
ncbi:hypothetical protein T265_07034 [Opisthorchis viverrini]|uniref:Uncharacterized protein n=1 Tax=Opisthorchis viverrini TaxID=6198 RepID=A0A074ZI89_OPIVI|nr:hypothetical protein T265_07034 [Opisthorchis viverrini]KER25517.1 hypothetical protein T265_07034 [Opisthorchis viverrini]